MYGVGSRYQKTGEDIADWKDLVRAVVNYGMCELAVALDLIVVTVCKSPINPITNRTPSIFTQSRDSMYHRNIVDQV
jgi:hypothetical protein